MIRPTPLLPAVPLAAGLALPACGSTTGDRGLSGVPTDGHSIDLGDPWW